MFLWERNYRKCDICGNADGNTVYAYCITKDLVKFCRHGHFEGELIEATTNMPVQVTGDKPIDALIWFPEGYVPQLWDRFWNGRG